MGLISGSGSFTRFFVNGTIPQDYMDEFPEMVAGFSFQSLDEYSDAERSEGWVNIMNIFNAEFMGKDFIKPPYIALSWRVDVRTVPRRALKQHCLEAEEEIKKSEDLEYLPKGQRRDIKDWMHQKLLKRAIPRTHAYDMIWNVSDSVLILGTTSNKTCDEFAEFFSKTFEMKLSSIFPYSLAYKFLDGEEKGLDLLDTVSDSDLVEVRQ
ncbi:MAG: recombination-associated protein RdgC [Deltaproteobacteria bacterium]|nr:recombination-associated protein RdgC [Deltaproteobacteria bacterium]